MVPEEQHGFRPQRSGNDMVFIVQSLQRSEQSRSVGQPLSTCFLDLRRRRTPSIALYCARYLPGVACPSR